MTVLPESVTVLLAVSVPMDAPGASVPPGTMRTGPPIVPEPPRKPPLTRTGGGAGDEDLIAFIGGRTFRGGLGERTAVEVHVANGIIPAGIKSADVHGDDGEIRRGIAGARQHVVDGQ